MTSSDKLPFHTWRLRTIALAKQVPRNDSTGEFTADGRLRRTADDTEMNPFCRRAVSHAVRFAQDTNGHSTVITMGPPSAADVACEAISWGADTGIHLSDPALAGADCLITARALASAIRRQGPADLIIVGRNSIDGDTGVIGPMIAELLGVPFIGPALFLGPDGEGDTSPTLMAKLQLDGAVEDVRIMLPAVVSVAERSCTPAKVPRDEWVGRRRVRTLSTQDLGEGPWGPDVSPTRVRRVRPVSPLRTGQILRHSLLEQNVTEAVRLLGERGVWLKPGMQTPEPSLAMVTPPARDGGRTMLVAVGDDISSGTQALLGEAAALAARAGAHVVALAPSEHRAKLARWGAAELITANRYDPGPLAAALATSSGPRPWAVLGPATGWGRELLARLSVLWDVGLVCDAVALDATGSENQDGQSPDRIVGSKPCGTRHVADIDSLSTTQIVTVRTGALPVRTPRLRGAMLPVGRILVDKETQVQRLARSTDDDYDALDRAQMVIGVGRGVDPTEYNRLAGLKNVLGAELAATRAVTDAAWLPHARQVGVTARSIAPRLYVATGMSGSPLHMAGVGRAGNVLAINSDPEAGVFAHSDIGIVGDWREVVPLLTAEIRRYLDRRSPAAMT
ncbi:FAD-binding protein [Streptomyces sp. RS2]|uniref:FAD-binding protein n=1 Tax=Streptomyces sp. RS2 TaxID=1451205 RepID=UPI0021F8C3C1|nr:FAD-binding protein [Streptomyces sp. RS2]MCW1100200.1 FAD-binding protein [Streptomyces sp. RS2]